MILNLKLREMHFGSIRIAIQWIIISLFVLISIVHAGFMINTNYNGGGEIGKELYRSREESVLQCAHMCTRISKDSVVRFDNPTMTCRCFSLGDGTIGANGATLSGTFQTIKTKVRNLN